MLYLNAQFPTQEEMSDVPTLDMGTCATTPTTLNWAGKVTTPIKDQGACGSCWAFAAVEQVETDIMLKFGTSFQYELSEEQLVDCARPPKYPNQGCQGGNPYYAFNYMKSYYMEQDSSYPYTSGNDGSQKTCKYNSNLGVAGLTSFSQLPRDETCMAQYIQQNGPLTAGVNALNWQYYNPSKPGGSIMTAAACGKGMINHAVQIVGVSIPGGYWIIRNTWGPNWGQQGYIWLEYGKNACNITAQMNTMFTTPFLYTSPTSPSRAPITSAKPTRAPSGPTLSPTRVPTGSPSYSLSPSVSPTDSGASSSSSDGASAFGSIGGVGVLAGIIAAVIVGVLIIAWVVWYCHRKKRAASTSSTTAATVSEGTQMEVVSPRRNPMLEA
jgi:hypothetical protein